MTPGGHYRARAAEFAGMARHEVDPTIRLQYEMLAQSYLRLADQAERNSRTDVVYENAGAGAPGRAAATAAAATDAAERG